MTRQDTIVPVPRQVDAPARRDAIVDAVWQVAARDGLDAVTARSVAAEAGMSLGAVTRTFPTQDELHVQALRRLASRAAGRLAALRGHGDPVDRAEALLAEVLPLTEETHAEAVVFYAYLARARAGSALQAIADEVDDALARLSREVVDLLVPGSPAAAAQARELHALTEGLALALVSWPHRRSRAQARAVLRGWLERLA